MIDRLDWTDWPERSARETMAQVVGAEDLGQLAPFDIKALAAPLPFYKQWRLVMLSSTYRESDQPMAMEDVYVLWRDGHEPLLLDGTSTPVHEANADESLQLDADHAADYIRFFCFAVRAEGQPFFLYEEPPEDVEDDPDPIRAARPLKPNGQDADGNPLFEATVVFTGDAFTAVFSVPPNGELTQTGVFLPTEAQAASPVPSGTYGSVRLQALAHVWPQPMVSGYLTLDESEAKAQGLRAAPVVLPALDGKIRNAGYALQWWAFAAFALVMSVLIARNYRRRGLELAD